MAPLRYCRGRRSGRYGGTPHFSTQARSLVRSAASRLAHFGPMVSHESRWTANLVERLPEAWRLTGAVDANSRTSRHGHCCSARSGRKLRHGDSLGGVGAPPALAPIRGCRHDRLLRGLRTRRRPLGGLRWSAMSSSRDNNDDIGLRHARTSSSASPRTEAVRLRSGRRVPDRAWGSRPLAARPEWPDRALGRRGHPLARIRCEDERAPELPTNATRFPAGSGVATRSDETSKSSSSAPP